MTEQPANISYAFVRDNARNESQDNIISNFIAPDLFWQLFSPHHHIILGSRGSGKTSVARMASFPFLKRSPLKRAQKLVKDAEFIGVFVNTDIRFVGSTKDTYLNAENLGDLYFIWKFNVNCLKSISLTIDQLLAFFMGENPERYRIELSISKYITGSLLGVEGSYRLSELDDIISDYEFECRAELNTSHLKGAVDISVINGKLSTEIFEPINAVIRLLTRSIRDLCATGDASNYDVHLKDISQSSWLFFIDEAEYLSDAQIKILNSFMRTHTSNIFLKIATLPYKYQTHKTNFDVPVQVDDDFFYVSLDKDPIYKLNTESTKALIDFATRLYRKRVTQFVNKRGMTISDYSLERITDLNIVLGNSILDTAKPLPENLAEATRFISKYVDEDTLARAKRLKSDRRKYGDQIWRKVSNPIHLIEDKRRAKGRVQMESYSGVEICIRCTDGVPRRMINLFHALTIEAFHSMKNTPPRAKPWTRSYILSKKMQTKILKEYSKARVSSSLSVPHSGIELRELIEKIGRYFEYELHGKAITTDIVSGFRVSNSTPDGLWNIIMDGIAYGYIFRADFNEAPNFERAGVFRLAYSLAPFFDLVPRKGKSRAISSVLKKSSELEDVKALQFSLGLWEAEGA